MTTDPVGLGNVGAAPPFAPMAAVAGVMAAVMIVIVWAIVATPLLLLAITARLKPGAERTDVNHAPAHGPTYEPAREDDGYRRRSWGRRVKGEIA